MFFECYFFLKYISDIIYGLKSSFKYLSDPIKMCTRMFVWFSGQLYNHFKTIISVLSLETKKLQLFKDKDLASSEMSSETSSETGVIIPVNVTSKEVGKVSTAGNILKSIFFIFSLLLESCFVPTLRTTNIYFFYLQFLEWLNYFLPFRNVNCLNCFNYFDYFNYFLPLNDLNGLNDLNEWNFLNNLNESNSNNNDNDSSSSGGSGSSDSDNNNDKCFSYFNYFF